MADNEKLVKEAMKAAKKDAADKSKATAKEQEETVTEAEKEKPEADNSESKEAAEEILDAETEAVPEDKKKSLFKKKKDKRDEQIEELNDKVVRQMAEFENFRKRTEKEKAQMFDIGAKSIIEKILPVIDTFERGFATLTEEQKEDPFVAGMEKTYKLMMDSLAAAGVTPIEAVGKEFDPNLHNAVMHEDNEELGENIVSQELQKGYMYHDTVVRFSMVKVAN